ncbi:hypothetical protein ACFOZ5_14390 [Marinobacter lacisalsi]|uniref:Lipoprotein n=1 Tax=Marinobacter lacisalsi TaxID=475979 RepID=A0ABV8QKE1_9GAMM
MRIILLSMGLVIGLAGCERSAAQDAEAYNRLCELYGEAQKDGQEGFARVNALANRVENELPEINTFFQYLSELPPDEAFASLKAKASKKVGRDWECEAARQFYAQ